jgi:hypothetical protein
MVQPGRLADRLLTGLGQPQIHPFLGIHLTLGIHIPHLTLCMYLNYLMHVPHLPYACTLPYLRHTRTSPYIKHTERCTLPFFPGYGHYCLKALWSIPTAHFSPELTMFRTRLKACCASALMKAPSTSL